MKKTILLSIIMLTTLIGCAESKNVASNEKLMRGDWTITNVSIDGINQSLVDITVFHQAKLDCFVGSSWHFVQNNSSGHYSLHGGNGCPQETTKIKWFLTEKSGQMTFKFKKIFEGEKPKHIVDGYDLDVVSNTGSHVVLRQNLSFEGQPIGVNYTFTKN